MDCSMPGFPVLHYFPEFAQTHVHWVSDAIQPSHPPSSPSPAFNLSQHQGIFQWGEYLWSTGASSSVSVFPMSIQGWFFLRLTGMITLLSKGLFSITAKASILQHSAFFIVQLSHPYMTAGKIIALTRWTFVSKIMSLLFNTLSRFIIAFLPRSKHLLISWLQSPCAVILEPKKIKSVTVSIVSPSIAMKWWDRMSWSSFFEHWVLSQLFHSPLQPSSRDSLVHLRFLP